MKIHHLNCATMCPRGGSLFGGEGAPWNETSIVAHCLLIEAGEDLVLIDTGLGTADVADPKRLGQPFRAFVRPVCDEAETAIRQIERLGLDPGSVRHVVPTHLDVDHAGGLGDFPDAEVHVFEPELAAAENPSFQDRLRYIQAQWAHGPQWRPYEIDGDDWFGFESVRPLAGLKDEMAIIPLVGHSAGSVGVAVNRPEGWLLHCGDAYFNSGDIADPPSSPAGVRAFQSITQHDGKARKANQQRLRELRRDRSDEVTIVCSHDPHEFASLAPQTTDA